MTAGLVTVRWSFARGGAVVTELDARAPRTVAALLAVLPVTVPALHARWSGREIGCHLHLPAKPPRELQSIRVNRGDVIFFREWEESFDHTGHEGVGFFYGPEITRDPRGDVAVNVIGCVLPADLDAAERIALRVWKQGAEDVTLTRVG